MPIPFHIAPRYIILIALALAALMFATAYIEIQQSKHDMIVALTEEAITLVETIDRSSETTVLSNFEFENLLGSRLLDNGTYVAYLDKTRPLTRDLLQQFAQENNIQQIALFDARGFFQNAAQPLQPRRARLDTSILRNLLPLMDAEEGRLVLGLQPDLLGRGDSYVAAIARHGRRGFILLGYDSRYLLDFRKRIGIGRLLQDIGDNAGIVYVVLQDEQGIIAASQGVSTMSRIEGDSLLQRAIRLDSTMTRFSVFEGREVFEVVKPFYVESGFYGLFRVGLSLERMEAFNRRTVQRFVILSIAVVIIGVIVFSFISARQNVLALREEYRKIQTSTGSILENMADAVVATDREGRITLFNRSAERIFGIRTNNVLGNRCSAVIQDPTSCIDRTLQTGQPVGYEEGTMQLKDGSVRIAAFSTSVIRDAAGAIDTVVAVIKDLTEQRKVEEQLRRQEKLTAMGELASGVAHEIRNPLNSISMTVQRFAMDFQPKEYQDEYYALVKTMQEEVRRVSTIIAQFLEFARAPKLNPTEVDAVEFVQHVLAVVESEARARDIHLQARLNYRGTIAIDRAQMQQALLNLLQNAFHAIGQKGSVSVETEQIQEHLFIRVHDTGSGILPEHLPKIFNLYFTTKPEGTGMGLSVVHQIITEHGGRIDVQSQIGTGTTFTITLPLRHQTI